MMDRIARTVELIKRRSVAIGAIGFCLPLFLSKFNQIGAYEIALLSLSTLFFVASFILASTYKCRLCGRAIAIAIMSKAWQGSRGLQAPGSILDLKCPFCEDH
jgi:Flp pilus assembly protein protease CpaA